MFLLYFLISRMNFNFLWLAAAVMLMLLFTAYRCLIGVDLPWNADLAILGAGFMALGKWASAVNVLECKSKAAIICQMLLALAVCVVCSYFNLKCYCYVDWLRCQFGHPLLFIVSAVACIVFTVRLSELYSSCFVSWLGANTLCFYGFHRIIIDYSFGVYNKLGIVAPKGSAAEFALALTRVALAVALLTPVCLFLLKHAPWSLGRQKRA